MRAVLTGADAREALGVYMGLGNAGARFHAPTVSRLVKSSSGRQRVMAALTSALRTVRPQNRVRRVLRAALRRRRVGAATASSGYPPRPAAVTASRRGT